MGREGAGLGPASRPRVATGLCDTRYNQNEKQMSKADLQRGFTEPYRVLWLVYCFFSVLRLQVNSALHIAQMVSDNPIGLSRLFTATCWYPDYVVATARAHHTRKFTETLRVSLRLHTATFLSDCSYELCCRIVLRALIRIDTLVYGLMWGSKVAHMTRVGAEAVDSTRPPCLPALVS